MSESMTTMPPDVAAYIVEREERIKRLERDNRRLVHERDSALSLAESPRGRVFAIRLTCDEPGCTAVIAVDPAPRDEARMIQILLSASWGVTATKHYCEGHK